LVSIGFKASIVNPCVFFHPVRQVRLVVHGDDFSVAGSEEQLNWFRKEISNRTDVKFRARLGDDDKDDKSVRILNRVVEWTKGIRYEADQRHGEVVVREAGLLEGSRSVSTPGVKELKEAAEGFSASSYRSVAARSNYLAQDRPDIQYAAKEVCRSMSDPKREDWLLVKRLSRYLLGSGRLVARFDRPSNIVVWTDSDYAGCAQTRKSTSGGVLMLGQHCIKSWSVTQDVIALSSGEAEYYSMVRGISQAIGLRNMLKDFGVSVDIELRTDASSAKAIASRRRCGKVRHIEVATLWVQEKVINKEVRIVKVDGADNVADILTKHVDRKDLDKHLASMGFERVSGRHSIMPILA
jgi:hypothetical protein